MTLKELLGEAYKDGLSVAEIESFLADKTLTDTSHGYVKKEVFDKTASDLAKIKKDLQAKLTDEEKLVESQKEKEEQLANLQRELALHKHEKTYLSKGYSADRAAKIAKALTENDFETVASETTAHAEDLVKAAKADALKGLTPPAGGGKPDPELGWGAKLAAENLKILGVTGGK